jgi:dihydrofolate reductase
VNVVVLSKSIEKATGYKVVGSAEEAISYLQDKGFSEIVVGGGTQVYNTFLNRNLVTDLFFNYVPVVVGDGGVLGTIPDLLAHFKLNNHKLLDGGIMQVHLRKE